MIDGFHPRWNGDLLAGSLKAETLFRLRLDGLRVVYSEPIYIGQRIRDIAQMSDGTIALWTDDTQLLFIAVDWPRLAGNLRSPAIHDTLRNQCMYCHHFGPTNPTDFAPSLSNLLNRKIASDNFRYTAALRNKDGVWTEENLRKFLADPSKFASGTTMPSRALNPEAIDEVVRDLARPHSASN
jgi:cytochrome c2